MKRAPLEPEIHWCASIPLRASLRSAARSHLPPSPTCPTTHPPTHARRVSPRCLHTPASDHKRSSASRQESWRSDRWFSQGWEIPFSTSAIHQPSSSSIHLLSTSCLWIHQSVVDDRIFSHV